MRKKLFAILMSAMMMVTFMPAMAFASNPDPDVDGHTFPTFEEDFYVDAHGVFRDVDTDKKVDYVVDYQAATCTTDGYVTVKCDRDEYTQYGYLKCDATYTQVLEADHAWGGGQDVTVDKYIKLNVQQGLMTEAVAAWISSKLADQTLPCHVEVKQCAYCDAYKTTKVGGLEVIKFEVGKNNGAHSPAKAAKCAAWTTCQDCGLKVANPAFNWFEAQKNHAPGNLQGLKETVVEKSCAHGSKAYEGTCKVCGETITGYYPESLAGTTHNFGTALTAEDYAKLTDKTGYVVYNTGKKFWSWATALEKAPLLVIDDAVLTYFEETGETVSITKWSKNAAFLKWTNETKYVNKSGKFVYAENGDKFSIDELVYYKATNKWAGQDFVECSVCGDRLFDNGVIWPAEYVNKAFDACQHTYVPMSFNATCDFPGYSFEICTNCLETKNWVRNGQDKLGHDYVVTATKATCTTAGTITVKCNRCKAEHTYHANLGRFGTADHGYLYFKGFWGELKAADQIRVEDVFAPMNLHEYSGHVLYQEATCEMPAVYAKQCKTCGKFDIHLGVTFEGKPAGHKYETTVVAPTCGTPGYSFDKCTVCGKYQGKLGSVEDFEDAIYDKKAPLVAPGAECTCSGEYVTTVEPTFAEVGHREMYCSVCNAKVDEEDIAKLSLKRAYIPKLTAGSKKITVKIAKETKNATGYQIAYKVAGNNNYKFVKTTSLTKTIKNLKKGKKYCFKIRAYAVEDGKTYYGAYCTVKYCKAK